MAINNSYSANYFSLDDILATQERIPCKFLINIPKLGALNPATDGEDLAAGTNLELPLWLVLPLSTGRQPTVSTEIPRIFNEAYREILKADPCAVDLYKWNLFFYEFGSYVKLLDSRGDISTVLIYTFINRFRKLMDLADNAGSNPTVQNVLDTLERGLFQVGHEARTKLNTWLVQTGMQLEAASMVVNHKKRKRVDLEDII